MEALVKERDEALMRAQVTAQSISTAMQDRKRALDDCQVRHVHIHTHTYTLRLLRVTCCVLRAALF